MDNLLATCILIIFNELTSRISGSPRGHGSGSLASRTVSVDPSSFRTEYRRPDEDSFPDWAKLLLGSLTIFGFVAAIFILRLCLKECHKRKVARSQNQPVTCYLCQDRVPKRLWDNGEHRKKCATRHKSKLATFETPKPGLRCPRCHKRMRLWTKGLGPPFKCCSSDCPILGTIQNNGQNRFNCFPCDYDLCDSCWRRQLPESRAQRTGNSRPSGSRSHRNSHFFPAEKQVDSEFREASAPPYFYPGFAYEQRSLTLPTYDEAIAGEYQNTDV
ncbi:hypothetical protein TCAL_10104 [Tigriopus californicus]|uniref:Uncharacterized protein n=1 Tax=Tigriopus californicus TaxID=6832 RepID=A0A553NYJ4_TIGCA|nr:uncharacterized protein LOC131886366 [Tigriopus californicus]TRY70488.1 hypothetical protein TCAL_10104 [Tigriopus californicus]|eukprot:TCALIF_10104-PA protein Name:"Protein of unknown function" AED:0.00 eAED:0.00 QI:62/1/1/1/1/1/2/133/272